MKATIHLLSLLSFTIASGEANTQNEIKKPFSGGFVRGTGAEKGPSKSGNEVLEKQSPVRRRDQEVLLQISMANETTSAPSQQVLPLPTSAPSLRALTPDVPSVVPSGAPSITPSHAPSLLSSDFPSIRPSDVPSSVPSFPPTEGDAPSLIPFVALSTMPSDAPSFMPSDVPSLMPSDAPSDIPSATPSMVPSLSPPLSMPTRMPNGLSTSIPTVEPTSDGEGVSAKPPQSGVVAIASFSAAGVLAIVAGILIGRSCRHRARSEPNTNAAYDDDGVDLSVITGPQPSDITGPEPSYEPSSYREAVVSSYSSDDDDDDEEYHPGISEDPTPSMMTGPFPPLKPYSPSSKKHRAIAVTIHSQANPIANQSLRSTSTSPESVMNKGRADLRVNRSF